AREFSWAETDGGLALAGSIARRGRATGDRNRTSGAAPASGARAGIGPPARRALLAAAIADHRTGRDGRRTIRPQHLARGRRTPAARSARRRSAGAQRRA